MRMTQQYRYLINLLSILIMFYVFQQQYTNRRRRVTLEKAATRFPHQLNYVIFNKTLILNNSNDLIFYYLATLLLNFFIRDMLAPQSLGAFQIKLYTHRL